MAPFSGPSLVAPDHGRTFQSRRAVYFCLLQLTATSLNSCLRGILYPGNNVKSCFTNWASSGIGLALAKHLLAKSWLVVMADIKEPEKLEDLPCERAIFVKADAGAYYDQANLFDKAFKWRGRLDFAALNAGIDDRDDTFASINARSPPTKLDMSTFGVDLLGVYYGIKLFAHYASKKKKSYTRWKDCGHG